MKKFIAALLAVFVLFAMCGCEIKPVTALEISGTKINSEILTYYADKVASRPSDYGLEDGPSVEEIKPLAIELCKKYIAMNTWFAQMELYLTSAEKTQVAQNVNDIWIRAENHYNKIGVSRQTLTKIKTSEAYENKVFAVLYDRGTGDSEFERELTDYFLDNYVSIRTVCAYFASGDGKTAISQQEKNELLENFRKIKSQSISGAEAFTQASQDYGYAVSDSVVISRNTEGYPDGFFDSAFSQGANTVKIIEYDDCVFAVYKDDLRSKGEGVYSTYRSACINALYEADYGEYLDNFIASLTVEEKSPIVNRIIKKVK
ncbi:MAG: hypothetical protein MJ173_00185 [Clostridia bacterium]|nr:hypothetical protein [Clostridia bacterium]